MTTHEHPLVIHQRILLTTLHLALGSLFAISFMVVVILINTCLGEVSVLLVSIMVIWIGNLHSVLACIPY